MVHLSIGSMYSWSLFNSALITSLGVVAPAAGDWSFATVVPIFSTIVGIHGGLYKTYSAINFSKYMLCTKIIFLAKKNL